MNKRNLLFFSFITALLLSNAGYSQTLDSVEMGADYTNDIYYSMAHGQTANPERTAWDIAFKTNIMSSSILINGGSGAMLYTYPKGDTGAWSSVDTNGLSTWEPMNNSLKNWEEGAFMANAGTHPDYGWGQYNNTTHKLYGDSIFIIQLVDGTYRKIWIEQKDSPKNIYYFRFAMLDGTDDNSITLDCKDYNTKAFVAYSLTNNTVLDREPIMEDWDILFTKYVDKVYMGPSPVNYPVTGILSNEGVYVAKITGKEETTYENYQSAEFDSADIHVIGRDWKKGVGMPPVYSIVDSQFYFIAGVARNIYKLYFTRFESGSSGNGVFVFNKKMLKSAGIFTPELTSMGRMSIYPNPTTSGNIKLVFAVDQMNSYQLDIVDLNGKSVFNKLVNANEGINTIDLSQLNLNTGSYIAVLRNQAVSGSIQFIVY